MLQLFCNNLAKSGYFSAARSSIQKWTEPVINVVLQIQYSAGYWYKVTDACVKANISILFTNTCLNLDGCSNSGRSGLVSSTVRIRAAVRHLSAAAYTVHTNRCLMSRG